MNPSEKATLAGIAVNAFLFAVKLYGFLLSGSIAFLSDAMNSMSDVITSFGIFVAVHVGHRRPDHDHPFGHHRAEPIAALLVALFAGIVAIEIAKRAITVFFSPERITVTPLVVLLVIVAILTKIVLARYYIAYGDEHRSPAISAAGIDSRNDVLASLLVLASLGAAEMGLPFLDPVASLLIAGFIAYSGYRIYRENLDYLMGSVPDAALVRRMRERAERVPGVQRVLHTRAQYVGNGVEVAFTLLLAPRTTLAQAIGIREKVEAHCRAIAEVDEVFVRYEIANRRDHA